jgi:hypothetical protein
MVPEEGLEPTLLSELDFESSASAIPPLGPSKGIIRMTLAGLKIQ